MHYYSGCAKRCAKGVQGIFDKSRFYQYLLGQNASVQNKCAPIGGKSLHTSCCKEGFPRGYRAKCAKSVHCTVTLAHLHTYWGVS